MLCNNGRTKNDRYQKAALKGTKISRENIQAQMVIKSHRFARVCVCLCQRVWTRLYILDWMGSVKNGRNGERIYLECLITERLVKLDLFFLHLCQSDLWMWYRPRLWGTLVNGVPMTLSPHYMWAGFLYAVTGDPTWQNCPSLHSNFWRSNWNRRS